MKTRLSSGFMLCFCLSFSFQASANTYTPNIFTDPVFSKVNTATGAITVGAGVGSISLRSALKAADSLGGNHIVNLATGTYLLNGSATYTTGFLGTVSSRTIFLGNTTQNITINGNGPGNTIISMAVAGRDRIMTINYDGVAANVFTTFNGVKFFNGYLTTDQFGGAAIYAGPVGGLFQSLVTNNCAFENNICPGASGNGGSGGAIYMFQETITVNNCTFTNNSTVDGVGGAIFFTLYNNQGNDGRVKITNSTFTGNSARELGGAIHITGQGAQPAGTILSVNVSHNTFLNNSTTVGLGGAMTLNNSPNISVFQAHYNRFVGNMSASSPLSSGLHFPESSGSVNAENNWWGCNSNPVNGVSTSPCNQAGGDVPGGGSLDADPWLQLKVTALPISICNGLPSNPGNTSTITASFLTNSSGTAVSTDSLSRIIGLPITWGPTTIGSLSSQQTTIQSNGNATALFTSNGTGGTATVNAEVDNVPNNETSPARASITVNTIPIVTLDPLSQTKCDPSPVSFTSTATSSPPPTLQWQVSTNNGMSFSNIAGATSSPLSFTAVYADNAKQYHAVFTNVCSAITSNNAILTVNPIEYPQFDYTKSAYCQMGTEDPLPNIYGTTGGIFSAAAGLSITPATGKIDVSASSLGGPYTVTYNTNGPCPKMATYQVSIVNCIPTAMLTDAIIIDNGTSGKADPNDRIRLTTTINNAQTADYNAVQLVTNNDSRVTLVPGSFKSTPVAVNDLYTTTLNTLLTVPIGTGLLANDFDNNIPGLTVTTFPMTSAMGGTIVGNANGSFTYNPANGFTGNDTFNYTITDSDAQTNSATVKIHVQ